MSEEGKKPEDGAEAGAEAVDAAGKTGKETGESGEAAGAGASASNAGADASSGEAGTAGAREGGAGDTTEGVKSSVGEQPAAADIGEGNASEQAAEAKLNAEDAQGRGVNADPGAVAEAVKELASDAPAPAGQAAAEGAPAAAAPAADPEREAKLRAAAEARAARAAAKAAAEGKAATAEGAATGDGAAAAPSGERPARTPRAAKAAAEDAGPKEPSPNQPLLDRLVEILKESVGDDVIAEAYINEMDSHRPCVVIKGELWPEAAKVFRDHTELKCDYLRNLSGVDQETHLEVVYHLLSITSKREYGVKVKTDREHPSVPSVTSIWETANWNEREAYDLLGIDFPGHPNLTRIMMPDDWVGHPLRKDYEPLDPEV
ncbi:NADH-quinone oxidoreductase subunit C [Paenibacillus chartarius]|uniref:NADH-quinone oxidoreductase subunit C n=1 Tax=Paenibacillus chartarius TaxID=747481 RepID=A0ABV6DUQ1_9BACL